MSKAIGNLVLTRLVATAGEDNATRETDTTREPMPESETGTPRWVKVFATIFFAIILLSLILMFTRGPHRGSGQHGLHGPGRHTPSQDPQTARGAYIVPAMHKPRGLTAYGRRKQCEQRQISESHR